MGQFAKKDIMKLFVADWLFVSGICFGSFCLLYSLYCVVDNILYSRRAAKLKMRELQDYIAKASKANEKLNHLLDHARARELELTEERNRLRDRSALLARAIHEDDICSEAKKTQVIGRLTQLWKLPK